jgi:hypothetical protein
MRVYTFSEARQKLAEVLDLAEGRRHDQTEEARRRASYKCRTDAIRRSGIDPDESKQRTSPRPCGIRVQHWRRYHDSLRQSHARAVQGNFALPLDSPALCQPVGSIRSRSMCRRTGIRGRAVSGRAVMQGTAGGDPVFAVGGKQVWMRARLVLIGPPEETWDLVCRHTPPPVAVDMVQTLSIARSVTAPRPSPIAGSSGWHWRAGHDVYAR